MNQKSSFREVPQLVSEVLTPNSAFEELHGFANGEEFADTLQRRSRRFFGMAGARYIKRLIRDRRSNRDKLRRRLRKWRIEYEAQANRVFSDAAADRRIRKNFSAVYASGCLAIRYRILRFRRSDLRKAILECERSHYRLAGQSTSFAVGKSDSVALIRGYVRDNRETFIDLSKVKEAISSEAIATASGFINQHKKRGKEYLIFFAKLANHVGSEAATTKALKVLKGEKSLNADSGREVSKRNLGRGRREYVCCFRVSVIDDAIKI